MSKAMMIFQKTITALGPPLDPERDPKISVALRPYLCFMRDEIDIANRAFIIANEFQVRRAALKKLIEEDYNRYMIELRKYDSAITRTQP